MARRSTRMHSHLSKEPGRALLAFRTDAPGLELWTILGGSIPNQRKLLFRDGRIKLFRTTVLHGRKQQAAEWGIAYLIREFAGVKIVGDQMYTSKFFVKFSIFSLNKFQG